MTRARTQRLRTPEDLLAIVPCLLGFHPEDSLVLVCLGEAGESFHARVDLPTDAQDVEDVVAMLSETVRRHGIASVAVVTFGEDHWLCAAVVGALHDRLERHGARVEIAVRATAGAYYLLADGDDGSDSASAGTPYDVSSHPFTVQAVLDGQVVLGSRRELADSLVGTDAEAIAAVRRAADRAQRRLDNVRRHPLGPPAPQQGRDHEVAEGRWVRERIRRHASDGARMDSDDTGRLLVALESIEVRDVAWAELTRSTAADHVRLWRDVVLRTPPDLMAPPAGLLGFAAWLAGDGALAWCALDRCREADPDYRLAHLLATALANGIPPTAWRPIPQAELGLFAS
jgi:hypothetical protein